MKRVIIIEGGIGGLSVAARLLHDGFKVDIWKNNFLGDKINCIKYYNFKFDLTASLLMMPDDYIKEITKKCCN